MKKRTNPQLIFGAAGLAFAASAGLVYLQYQSLGAKKAEVVQLREKDREQQLIYSKLEDSKKQLQDLQTKLVHLERGIPDAAYVPSMLKELELAGKQKGIEVTGLRPMATKTTTASKDKDDQTKKPYQPLDLEMKGRGKYTDLLNFVQTLNSFPKIVAVRTVSINPTVGKSDDHRLEITVGLRAFVFQANGAKPAGGSV